MTLRLVSSNANPRPQYHEAEWLQVEQEAQGWSVIWAVAFGSYLAGVLSFAAVAWVIARWVLA